MDKELLNIVATVYGYTKKQLVSPKKNEHLPEARRMVLLFLNVPNVTHKTISKIVNRTNYNVTRSINQICFEILQYKATKRNFEMIYIAFYQLLIKEKSDKENWLKNNPCFDAPVRDTYVEIIQTIDKYLTHIQKLKNDLL